MKIEIITPLSFHLSKGAGLRFFKIKTRRWIMFKNTVILLIYHRHRYLGPNIDAVEPG
jgi:hypothetical protein